MVKRHDSFLQGMSDSVTKDTVWKDLMAMPVSQVIDADTLTQVKEQYQIGDDEMSDSTTYEEFQKVLYQKAAPHHKPHRQLMHQQQKQQKHLLNNII